MPKYLKTAFVKNLEFQVQKHEISYTRMLELIQEEVIINYQKNCKYDKKTYTATENGTSNC
jgi:competence protein ComGC